MSILSCGLIHFNPSLVTSTDMARLFKSQALDFLGPEIEVHVTILAQIDLALDLPLKEHY